MSNRKFNQKSYDAYDSKCKKAAIDLMKRKGFHLVGDINTEHYKKYDVAFINELGQVLKIENEFRGPFDKIKNSYPSIHIPIRKKDTECDFYFIWGNDYKDLAIIKKETIKKYNNTIVNNVCAKGKPHQFTEDFIDIPKKEVQFYSYDNFSNRWLSE
jgi:hypothetical protein